MLDRIQQARARTVRRQRRELLAAEQEKARKEAAEQQARRRRVELAMLRRRRPEMSATAKQEVRDQLALASVRLQLRRERVEAVATTQEGAAQEPAATQEPAAIQEPAATGMREKLEKLLAGEDDTTVDTSVEILEQRSAAEVEVVAISSDSEAGPEPETILGV